MHVDNAQGIRNLCDVARKLLQEMPINAAMKFAVRAVLREAANKSTPNYRGNNNRLNCRYVSVSASQLMHDPDAELIADHAIPISVLIRKVYELRDRLAVTTDALVNLVGEYSVMVLITDEEDDCIAQSGLSKRMPDDWDGEDVLARYEHAHIEVVSARSLL